MRNTTCGSKFKVDYNAPDNWYFGRLYIFIAKVMKPAIDVRSEATE